MNSTSELNELIVKFVKYIILFYIFWHYGFFKVVALLILLNILIQILLYYIFKIEELTSLEKNMLLYPRNNRSTIIEYIILESFQPEKIKSVIIEKGLKSFSKLRMKIVNEFAGYYWKEFPLKDALDQIKILSEVNLKNLEELEKYTLQEQYSIFNVGIGNYFYEFQIVKHGNKGILIFKYDSLFSNEIGMIGLLIALSDKCDINAYPKLNEPSLFWKFLIYLFLPLYILRQFITNQFLTYNKTPFRLGEDKKRTNRKKIVMSPYYSLDPFTKMANKHNLSFNDLFMSAVSTVAKNALQEFKPEDTYNNKSILCGFSVSLNTKPGIILNHNIINSSAPMVINLKLIDDPIAEGKIIQKCLGNIQHSFLSVAQYYMKVVFDRILPSFFITTDKDISHCVDLFVSTVPGPSKELSLAGIVVTELIFFQTANNENFYLSVVTYNNKFQITSCSDTGIQICPQSFMLSLEREIEDIIEEYLVTELKESKEKQNSQLNDNKK